MPKFKQIKVRAVEGQPNADGDRLKFYTAEIPASAVATFEVDRALDVEGGFQRPLDMARAKRIGQLMGGDKRKERLPDAHVHGGLLAYPDEPGAVSYSPSTGKLTIRKPLKLLDGQTRAGGAAWAADNGMVSDYTETVRIVVGSTLSERVKWYLISNMTARKVQPTNVLLNIATMSGTQNNRKSWIARTMIAMATDAPFTLQRNGTFTRIVSFGPRDGGRMSAYTLYKAINFMLPDDLNKEGAATEKKALAYVREAFRLYASMYDDWGQLDEDVKLRHIDAYEFTMLAAFARFYKAVKTSDVANPNEVIRNAWVKAGFDKGIPEGSGSGERAAIALASYAAGEANLRVNVAA